MASRTKQKEAARQRRIAEEKARAEQARRTRRLRMLAGVVIGVAVAAAVAIAISTSGGNSNYARHGGPRAVLSASNLGPVAALGHLTSAGSPGASGPEGVPVPTAPALAPAASPAPGHSVDGISCQGGEQTLFHVHTHLTVFVNGAPRQIPAGVGISSPQAEQTSGGPYVASGACFTWLHTHAGDGIIHIESPVQRTFTLGNFFDVWGQPLSPTQVGPVKGAVTAFYNGKHYIGDPRNIPLGNHIQIQLDVNKPLIAPETISWTGLGL